MGFPVSLSCGSIPGISVGYPWIKAGIPAFPGINPSRIYPHRDSGIPVRSGSSWRLPEGGGNFSAPIFPGKRSGTTGEGKTASELQQGEGQDGHPEEFFPWKKRPGLGIARGGLECPSLEASLDVALRGCVVWEGFSRLWDSMNPQEFHESLGIP